MITALGAIAIIVAVGFVVHARWLASPRPVARRSAATAVQSIGADTAPTSTASIVDVRGRVEKQGASGWLPLAAGDRLTAQDTIRTDAGANATIDIGDLVIIDERTELTVGEITQSVLPLSLAEGRVQANAGEPGGRTIRIATRDTDAIAETTTGTFDVLSSGNGFVAVAAEQGQVQLTARGATVDVAAGHFATVAAGAPPSDPKKIPTSLFLKVNTAGGGVDRTVVAAQTTPGSVVRVNEEVGVANDAGWFGAEVPLKRGENVIIISVVDALGRSEQQVIKKQVKPPKLEAEANWE